MDDGVNIAGTYRWVGEEGEKIKNFKIEVDTATLAGQMLGAFGINLTWERYDFH